MSVRLNLSGYHLKAATLQAKSAEELETRHGLEKEFNNDITYQHFACVTGAIISCTFFLESAINEIFSECADKFTGQLPSDLTRELPEFTRSSMRIIWEYAPRFEKSPTLDKYDVALNLAEKKFDKESENYKGVRGVFSLRNYLVHYKPQSFKLQRSPDFKEEGIPDIVETLTKKNFKPNPFIGSPLPEHELGYDCAKWCIDTSRNFLDDFSQRIGMTPFYVICKIRL